MTPAERARVCELVSFKVDLDQAMAIVLNSTGAANVESAEGLGMAKRDKASGLVGPIFEAMGIPQPAESEVTDQVLRDIAELSVIAVKLPPAMLAHMLCGMLLVMGKDKAREALYATVNAATKAKLR